MRFYLKVLSIGIKVTFSYNQEYFKRRFFQMRALLSVSDKAGIVEFAKGLEAQGWDIISTGGT